MREGSKEGKFVSRCVYVTVKKLGNFNGKVA